MAHASGTVQVWSSFNQCCSYGFFSIPDPIPDPGVKKAPDPDPKNFFNQRLMIQVVCKCRQVLTNGSCFRYFASVV